MDKNVFSLFSLDKTKSAISELQNLMLCHLCNLKARDPVCLSTCDHFFCSKCLDSVDNSFCPVCQIPTPPAARTKDHVVSSLLSSSEDLLKIFNGQDIEMQSQGIEAPLSLDLTTPYCTKTPITSLKSNKLMKDKSCWEKNISNKSAKGGNMENVKKQNKQNVKKQSKQNVTKQNKENYEKSTIVPQNKLIDVTAGPSTPKHQLIVKAQDLTPAVHKRNTKGETSLHSWCIKGDLEKVRILLEEGANPNTRDNAGWTPLHEASSHGFLEIAELLLQNGALVNVPGNNNETTLHDAVISSCLPMICLLRKWGANVDLKNIWGRTARELSAINASQDVCEAMETPENPDLVAIPKQLPVQSKVVILEYGPKSKDNKKKLLEICKFSKFNLVEEFCPEVTHLIVNCSHLHDNFICERTVVYMTAVASGKTIISNKWIDACLASNSVESFLDFEVVGTICNQFSRAPEKARKNTLQMNPNLFSGCHFFFNSAMHESAEFKNNLEMFIKAGGGIYLHREPNPESIGDIERTVPFHYRSNGHLSKCSHFIIYRKGSNEPRMKYDMPHLKSFPEPWLFGCVEKFEIVDFVD